MTNYYYTIYYHHLLLPPTMELIIYLFSSMLLLLPLLLLLLPKAVIEWLKQSLAVNNAVVSLPVMHDYRLAISLLLPFILTHDDINASFIFIIIRQWKNTFMNKDWWPGWRLACSGQALRSMRLAKGAEAIHCAGAEFRTMLRCNL